MISGFFCLFVSICFWCVCSGPGWEWGALRNESLIFKNQVKTVSLTFRLNFISLWPWPPSNCASVTVTHVDTQTHHMTDFDFLSAKQREKPTYKFCPQTENRKTRDPSQCSSPAGWPHLLRNHHLIAVLFSYFCKHPHLLTCSSKSFFSHC